MFVYYWVRGRTLREWYLQYSTPSKLLCCNYHVAQISLNFKHSAVETENLNIPVLYLTLKITDFFLQFSGLDILDIYRPILLFKNVTEKIKSNQT